MLSPIAWTVYIALPTAGWGWLNGLPLGVIEAGAIALVWWAWALTRQLPGARILTALIAAKLLLGALLLDGGFVARYYSNERWEPPVEHSIEFQRSDITRRDDRLAFGGPQWPDLPLHFQNHLRFNYYKPTEPRRDLLAYSVAWEGFLEGGGSPSERTFYLASAAGTTAELSLDGRAAIVSAGAGTETAAVAVAPGWHQIAIRLSAPYGAGRAIEAGEIVEGERRPFSAPEVLASPAGPTRRIVDAGVRWLSTISDLAILMWIAALTALRARGAWRDRRVGQLLWLAAIGEALLFTLGFQPRVTVLTGGDDWLTYEHLAMAIALGDPLLMERGIGPGQGGPFYVQALYPYILALTHLVFGDGIGGVALVQRLSVAATAGWIAAIATRLFGDRVGWIALLGGGLFLYEKAAPWSGVLLAEPLFAAVLAFWVWLLVKHAADPPARWRLAGIGAVGGIATLLRSTLFLAWPVVIGAWLLALRASRVRRGAALLAGLLCIVGLLTVRTWIVAGTFALAPSSGAIAIAAGNEPSSPLDPTPADRQAIYDRLALSVQSRVFLELAAQRPREFLGNFGQKALYSAGLFGPSGIESQGTDVPNVSWWYVGAWCLAIVGGVRLLRTRTSHPPALVALPALAALCHFGVMVLFLPNVYGDRMILPGYPLLLPYAAFGLEPLVAAAIRHAARAAAVLLAALALFVLLPASLATIDLAFPLLAGLAILAFVTRPWPQLRAQALVYLAYAVALTLLYARARYQGDGRELDFSHNLLVPIAVFGVAWLGRHRLAFRVAALTLAAGVLVSVIVLRPAVMPGVADLPGRIGDIRRDVQNVMTGNPGARQELNDDASEAFAFVQPSAALGRLRTEAGVVPALCLLAIWLQALMRSRRYWRRGGAAGLACVVGLAAVPLLIVIGIAPSGWGGGHYSLATLALLFGLAEALPALEQDREATSAPLPTGS